MLILLCLASDNNLKVTQVKAIKDLNVKMKDENLVCFESDKTGHLTLDTMENYVKKMNKHIENDVVIPARKVRTIENKLNEHAEHAIKMTNAGENSKIQIKQKE